MKMMFSIYCAVLMLFNGNIHAINSPTIHVFGDSHSREFAHIPNCVVHWLGPITMHRVGRDNLSFLICPYMEFKKER